MVGRDQLHALQGKFVIRGIAVVSLAADASFRQLEAQHENETFVGQSLYACWSEPIPILMNPLTLVPLITPTAFVRHLHTLHSKSFTVGQRPAATSVLVVNAASDNDIGGTLTKVIANVADVAKAIRGGAALLFDCSTEGPSFHQPTWEKLYWNLNALGIDGSRVVYITNNHAFKKPYERWALETGLNALAVLPYNYFFRSVVNGIRPHLSESQRRRRFISSIFPSSHPRPARYLCLNNRLRGHRLVVLGRLVRLGVFDNGLVSMLGGDADRDAVTLPKAVSSARELFPKFAADLDSFQSLISRIPISIAHDNSANRISSIYLPLYSQTWFSFVNESEMTNGGINRFTEKTVKPLLAGHPFLIAGNPGVLSLLKSYGFQTFNPLINEAYDAVVDRQDRLDALLEEFNRLTTLSDTQISRLAADLWPAHDHNLRHAERNLCRIFEGEEKAIEDALRRSLSVKAGKGYVTRAQ
jgi:hypothetical protein